MDAMVLGQGGVNVVQYINIILLYIAQKKLTQSASSKRASAAALPLLPAVAIPIEVSQRVEGEFLDHGDDAVL